MKLTIDESAATLTLDQNGSSETLPLYSDAAFEAIARQYVRVGWNQKHLYTFSWMGRPIIQFPDDLLRLQEVIHNLQPDLIIETGVAHGGSLVFYASLMEAMDRGQVLGIDIEIRPHNRVAIESHPLFHRIELLEGSSTSKEIVDQAREMTRGAECILVILDSDHSYSHVMAELDSYSSFVTLGSYIVATDGVMRDVVGAPRAGGDWETNNPANAAEDWVSQHPEFEIVQPSWPFNESTLQKNVTHFPNSYLQRRK
ncbi:MAG: CmcI family methyltransferase [Gammaproteobacteria bacterium]|nr:CmcI family methyltransferase [Gammaproteobacteria bacterium]